MKKLIHKDFLLFNKTGVRLFHEVAKALPVIDYHNHLNPLHLAENKKFDNLAQLWITSDPYKHRAMRIHGIPEQGISGEAEPYDKYMHWVKTLPHTLGNPLFHWNALELKRVFGIDKILNEKNAKKIWKHCNALLQEDGFGATDILKKFNTEMLCTSDDLLDDYQSHLAVGVNHKKLKVLPSLRADSILAFHQPNHAEWMEKLMALSGIQVHSLVDYEEAIMKRLQVLDQAGCRFSDHALDSGFTFQTTSASAARKLFAKRLEKQMLPIDERIQLQSYLLTFLGKAYADRGWTMQLHIGAQRYTSSRLRKLAGPTGGFAAMGSACDIASLCAFLDSLEQEEKLPQTILYTLNPADNAPFATLTGSFAEDGMPGKIQFGPAWWYNDHLEGMENQLTTLASHSLLSHFIGMTTDSRSILSFSRHEYFRRILCNWIGKQVEEGKFPDDFSLLKNLVERICYLNIKHRLTSKN
ncbi:glucuronate isomerase [Catalinimonas sp. 4WD22]|uniref:glucuronate isomerase n=1 Tax=Catalinimonas locisalis TaxID=3133978 RepID=UPI003100EA9D